MPEQTQVFNNRDDIVAHIVEEICDIYNTADVTTDFGIPPATVEKAERGLVETNDFLRKINNETVSSTSGKVLRFGVPDLLMGRNQKLNKQYGRRTPRTIARLKSAEYLCRYFTADSLVTWGTIDSYQNKTDVYGLYKEKVSEARATSRLKVAWNGQFFAEDTDPFLYDMGQDVMPGWFQYLIDNKPENVLGIKVDADAPLGYTVEPIKVGEGGQFGSIDELVFELRNTVLNKHFRKKSDLRVVLGDHLTYAEKKKLYASADNEKDADKVDARNRLLARMRYGEVIAEESDGFPDRGVFLSPLSNISFYLYEKVRRKIDIDHNNLGIVDYFYGNGAFVLEALEGAAAVHPDAILLKDKDGNWVHSKEVWKAELPEELEEAA